MKEKGGGLLPLLAALALVAAGAALPFVVAVVGEGRLLGQQESRPLSVGQLALEADSPLPALTLLAQADWVSSPMPVEQGDGRWEKMIAAAQREAGLLTQAGLLSPRAWAGQPLAQPLVYASSRAEGSARVLWKCAWYTGEGTCKLILDEISQKIVQVEVRVWPLPLEQGESTEDLARRWADFWGDYFGLSAALLEVRGWEEAGERRYLELSDPAGFCQTFPLVLREGIMEFGG